MNATKPPLTLQQLAALDARDRSVSLAAGAGCGKTFVLTERFLAELDGRGAVEAAELDHLVAITFTDAAAREMRSRIRRRCYERLQAAHDDVEAAAWQRLMRSMDAARISTIHSFCATLLRTHAVEAGLDPQFGVLDAAAAELLKLQTVDDRLRELLIEGDDDALELAARRGLDALRSDLASFCAPRNQAAIRLWRDATPRQLVARWIEYLDNEAGPRALDRLWKSPEMDRLRRAAAPELARTDRLRKHLALVAAEARADSQIVDAPAERLASLRTLAKVQGVCTAKDWLDAEQYNEFRDAAAAVRGLIDASAAAHPIEPEAAHEAAAIGLALVRLAAHISESLETTKQSRNQLEFDDLLIRAERLLADPAQEALRRQVVRRTRLIMVDEFQDTNPQQIAIITALCGDRWRERGLFAVGDFKQSIYRFNGAEPSVSNDLRQALPREGRLSLTTNFRSQPAVLDFINAVFHGAFAEYERLEPARTQLTATPAVEFLWAPGPQAVDAAGVADRSSDAGGEIEQSGGKLADEAGSFVYGRQRSRRGASRDARALEARWIARRLVELLESPDPLVVETVGGVAAPRRLKLGDIAILLRSLSDAQVYEEALRELGLDYYLAGGHAFYSQQEIFDVLNLLRATASAVDEIALAGALRSPMFSLTDETLMWMVQRHGSLNAAIDAGVAPPQLAGSEAEKLRRAAATIGQLRLEKDRLLAAELVALSLELTGYDATLLCDFLGPRKAANVGKLVEQARALDRSAPGDLTGFIAQLSEFVLRAPKEALAATQSEGDVIRIMTIHYAKGLEFPLVVLPDLERRRRLGGFEAALDRRLGPLAPLGDRGGDVGRELYRLIEDAEDLDERKRLLYVACTRASDYLMLSSSIDNLDRPTSDWLQLVDSRVSLADGSLRVALPPEYGTPRVRVTTAPPKGAGASMANNQGHVDLHRLVAKTRELAASARDVVVRAAEPVPADAAARRRFSFSQITGALTTVDAREPAWIDGEADEFIATHSVRDGDAAKQFGRLVHAVLERVDFRRRGDVRELCDWLAPQYIGRDSAACAVDAASLVERFLKSPRAEAIAEAPLVRREMEFLLPWSSSNGLCPSTRSDPNASRRYLHGYIDCIYQDAAGQWHLMDFKTNRVHPSIRSSVVAQYEMQVLAYRLACERALGAPISQCALALLHLGDEHVYRWSSDDERRILLQITKAMDQLAAAAA